MTDRRPDNREVENENQRPPTREGEPPRPATEPRGGRVRTPKATETDPATGKPSRG